MKLVVATPLYPPEPGGPATYAKLLEGGLPGLGDAVTLVKFSEVRKYPKVIRHIIYCWRVFRAAQYAELVLALDPISTGFPALLGARIAGRPFVVKVVGDYAWEQGQQRYGVQESLDEFVLKERVPFAVACFKVMQSFVAKSATRVIVPSEYLKTIVTKWGVSPKKIFVIYNSIEVPAELPEVSGEFSRMPGPRVVTTGRLVPWKHIDGIIDAVAELEGVSLVVVGDGPQRAALEARGLEKLGSRILFTGAQPHDEALALMKAGDVFVLNSSYEGLSHLLIEALMLGKAIVATSVGGNPELITNEENGLLVEVGDTEALSSAIARVLNDHELSARLAARAQQSSGRFSTHNMLSKTHELLSSLI